jgi:hypothetical protein
LRQPDRHAHLCSARTAATTAAAIEGSLAVTTTTTTTAPAEPVQPSLDYGERGRDSELERPARLGQRINRPAAAAERRQPRVKGCCVRHACTSI